MFWSNLLFNNRYLIYWALQIFQMLTHISLFDIFLKSHPLTSSPQRRQWHPTPVLLPGKSHGRRSLEGCSPWGHWGSETTERLHFHFSLSCIGEGNGNPLQCSCLENPRDGGAWWAAVYGVAQNRTRLKWLRQQHHHQAHQKNLSSMQSCRDIYMVVWVFLGFPGSSAGKESPCNAGDPGLIPGSGNSPAEGIRYPLQYSCLVNSMDRGTWRATVHGVAESDMTDTSLSQ